jgi:hypothetical protein
MFVVEIGRGFVYMLFSGRAPEREPSAAFLLPFLRYRLNVIFEGNSVVGACLIWLYDVNSLLITKATRNGPIRKFISLIYRYLKLYRSLRTDHPGVEFEGGHLSPRLSTIKDPSQS